MEASRLWDTVAGESGTLDPLTRLPNHLGFQSVLGRELARAKRTGQSLAVSLVDLDGLAGYTAQHGAAEADRVLRLAAGGLAGGVRSYDCVCRLDEGQFALVLPGMTAESAAALVGRLAGGFCRWTATRSPSPAAWPPSPNTRQPTTSSCAWPAPRSVAPATPA